MKIKNTAIKLNYEQQNAVPGTDSLTDITSAIDCRILFDKNSRYHYKVSKTRQLILALSLSALQIQAYFVKKISVNHVDYMNC